MKQENNNVDWYRLSGRTLLVLGASLLSIHVILIAWACFAAGFDAATTYVFDGDAQRNILLAEKAGFGKDHGWYTYGPFFYRSAQFLSKIVPNFLYYSPGTTSFIQSSINTGFKLQALICFIVFLLWLSKRISFDSRFTPIIALSLSLAFFSDKIWLGYLLRTYPDGFLSVLLGLSALAALSYYVQEDESKDDFFAYLSIFLWVCAFHTKVTAAFYAPGLAILWTNGRWFSLKTGSKVLLTLFFLWLVSYPLFFVIVEHWSSIASGGLSYGDELSMKWVNFFMDSFLEQIDSPALIVMVGGFVRGLLLPTRVFRHKLNFYFGLTVMTALPLALFLLNPVVSPAEYYPMSLVPMWLIFVAVLSAELGGLVSKLGVGGIPAKRVLGAFIVVCFSGYYVFKFRNAFLPELMVKTIGTIRQCSKDIETISDSVRDLEGTLIQSPYVPSFQGDPTITDDLKLQERVWTITSENTSKIEDLSGVILSARYYSRFYSNATRTKSYIDRAFGGQENLDNIKAFLDKILKVEEYQEPSGRTWKKVLKSEPCNLVLWKVE